MGSADNPARDCPSLRSDALRSEAILPAVEIFYLAESRIHRIFEECSTNFYEARLREFPRHGFIITYP